MSWITVGGTAVSLIATGVGTGMSYMAQQEEAANQKALADMNYGIQARNAKINATIAKRQANLKKTYAQASMNAKEVNAKNYEAQANSIETQGREEARRMREQQDAAMASIRSDYAATGVTSEGTPIVAMADTAGKLELAIQDAKWQSDTEATKYRDAAKMERYQQNFDRADMLVADYEAKLAKMGQQLDMDQAYFDRAAGYAQSSATKNAAYGTLISGVGSMASTTASFASSAAGQKLFGSKKTFASAKVKQPKSTG